MSYHIDTINQGRPISGDALEFMLAGNATFTLVSRKTNARFTFKIQEHDEKPGLYFVKLMIGPSNEQDFLLFGLIEREQFRVTKKAMDRGITMDTDSVRAFRYTYGNLKAQGTAPGVDVWHEGRCGRCNRKLTVPSSLASGIGPECAMKMAVAA